MSKQSWSTQLIIAIVVGAIFLAGLPIVFAAVLNLVPALLTMALLVGIIGLAVGAWRRRW